MPVKAEHEHTCNGLLAHALESFQLSFYFFIGALLQVLKTAFTSFCLQGVEYYLQMLNNTKAAMLKLLSRSPDLGCRSGLCFLWSL